MKRAAIWAAVYIVGVGSLTLRQGYAQDAAHTAEGDVLPGHAAGNVLFSGEWSGHRGNEQIPYHRGRL